VFWIATRAIKWKVTGINELVWPWTDWLQNFTLTQWLTLLWHPTNYAVQNPSLFVAAYSSLDYEEQFYVLFGVMLVIAAARAIRVRTAVAALMAASVAWIAVFPELCYGLFIEYWAMFGVGALIFYRLCRLETAARRRLADMTIVGLVLLFVSICLRGAAGNTPVTWIDLIRPQTRVAWNDLAVSSGFALLLLLIRPLNDWYKRNRWCSLPLGSLGLISYSLYLVHQFNLTLVATAVAQVLHVARVDNAPMLIIGALQCAAHVAIASMFWYFCERPFLNKSLLAVSGSAALAQQNSGHTKE
jgi:peptidoglycan/LPS O-acetylase OafA/YrhL